jgi:hypothetical protein
MPWTPDQATEHTHLADTPRRKRMFAHVANQELERTGDDGEAVRIANGVLKHDVEKHGKNEPKSEHWSGA